MKTITKTFYVSDMCFQLLKNNKVILTVSDFKDDHRINEIQISWQEPEKKIELSESRFEELKNEWISYTRAGDIDYHTFLKNRIFGSEK